MFGKICRSVEHFLHWCKRRGGQRRRGGRGRVELRVPAPGRSPTPHVPLLGRGAISRFLSILDPFSGPATFALGQAPVIPPQQSLLSSAKHRSPASPPTAKHRSPVTPPTPRLLPAPGPHPRSSLRNRSGPRRDALCALGRDPRAALPLEDSVCGGGRGGDSRVLVPPHPRRGTAGWQPALRGSTLGGGGRFLVPPE